MDDEIKFDKLEERLRGTETALSALTASISLNTSNIKENMAKGQAGLGDRIDMLHADMKENIRHVQELSESLQNLYVSHSGSQNTIKFNEKLVWGIVTVVVTAGLYLLQAFLKTGVLS